MRDRALQWLVLAGAIVLQFLAEVTLGRWIVAPAILIPVLVYMTISRDDYWSIEGAFWSGFILDLLLHQPPGTSSLAMILGLLGSDIVLKATTGAIQMTFVAKALLASLLSDLIFILLASSPAGSGFGKNTLLILPRIFLPLLLYLIFPFVQGRRDALQERTSQ